MPHNGSSYLLFIDTVTPITANRGSDSEYRPVTCLRSNSFGIEAEGVEYRNKSDNNWVKSYTGYRSFNLDADGYAIGLKNDEKLVKSNFQELAKLCASGTVFWARQTDDELTINREGLVRIASFRETANMDEPYSFTVSLVGVGEPILEEEINKYILSPDSISAIQDGNTNLIQT